jgi:hypothetical protein
MPDPLPSDVVARLKSDPTAALAAALILAGSFPDLAKWALTAFGGDSPSREQRSEPGARGLGNGVAKGDGARKRARGNGAHAPRKTAADHDQALLSLMRANPGARSTEIIRLSGRPRNSTVLSLQRLEKAGLVEHARRGNWAVVPPDSNPGADLLDGPAEAPKPRGWIAPLSGARVARHSADGRVRDEISLSGR